MKPIVLMYHDVYDTESLESGFSTPGAKHYKISKKDFIAHIDAISRYCNSKMIKKESIVFTFDDGGVSFYTIIAPILEEYGWRGNFFISTKYIGTKGFMSATQILDLYSRGHIIGSHSHHHKILTEISLNEVDDELKTSVLHLTTILNESIKTLSIPNGCYSKDILEIAMKNGFKTIYTSKPTIKIKHYDEVNLIGRYSINYKTNSDEVIRIISSASLRFKMECKYQLLQIIKLILGTNYHKIKLIIREYLIK